MVNRICIVGHGALAGRLMADLPSVANAVARWALDVAAWDDLRSRPEPFVDGLVVHAGSGRQLAEVISFCQSTKTPLLQASTGCSAVNAVPSDLAFAVVEAPNLAIPVVKLLHLMRQSGHRFSMYDVSIVESHQEGKHSLSGTAVEFARAVGVSTESIVKVRNPALQNAVLGVPADHLARHAVHTIRVSDGDCWVTFRTEVHGLGSYVRGVISIAAKVDSLPPGRYHVVDLIDRGII